MQSSVLDRSTPRGTLSLLSCRARSPVWDAHPPGRRGVHPSPSGAFGLVAVVRPVGREVGEECLPPAVQGPSETGDLGDRAGVERGQDLLGTGPALTGAFGAVGGPQVLGAAPRGRLRSRSRGGRAGGR